MKLSIIICVYNEVGTIIELVHKVLSQKLSYDLEKEIIIIDNNSQDGTKLKLKHLEKHKEIKVIYQKKNMGKGNSIIQGIKFSTGDLVIFQDADLEYNPKDYNNLIKKLIIEDLDAVYGSRVLNNKKYHRYKLNEKVVILYTKLINFLYKTNFTDSATNYKLIRAPILKKFKLISKSFAIDFEITINLGIHKCKCAELPIDYNPRSYAEGKKINYLDAIKSLLIIFYYFLNYRKKE